MKMKHETGIENHATIHIINKMLEHTTLKDLTGEKNRVHHIPQILQH